MREKKVVGGLCGQICNSEWDMISSLWSRVENTIFHVLSTVKNLGLWAPNQPFTAAPPSFIPSSKNMLTQQLWIWNLAYRHIRHYALIFHNNHRSTNILYNRGIKIVEPHTYLSNVMQTMKVLVLFFCEEYCVNYKPNIFL